MKRAVITGVRDDEQLRASFNELTEKTFGFNFEGWYSSGGWGDKYIPYVIVEDGRVISDRGEEAALPGTVSRVRQFRLSGSGADHLEK